MKPIVTTMAIAAAGALGVWLSLRAFRRNETSSAAVHPLETWEGEGGLLPVAPPTHRMRERDDSDRH